MRRMAKIALVVLSLMTVATLVILDNAMHIGPLAHLTITLFVWAMVGLSFTFLACAAITFAIGAWLLKHRVRNA